MSRVCIPRHLQVISVNGDTRWQRRVKLLDAAERDEGTRLPPCFAVTVPSCVGPYAVHQKCRHCSDKSLWNVFWDLSSLVKTLERTVTEHQVDILKLVRA